MLRFTRCLHIITNWNESQIIVDRKSKFQGRSVALTDPLEVPAILSQFLSEHKSIAKNASHPHIYAWRTGVVQAREHDKGTRSKKRKKDAVETPIIHNLQQGFKDDGEKGAGEKLLDHLVKNSIINQLVLVTRWYGGSPIGSLRFRHICNAAMDSVRRQNAHAEKNEKR